jgi:hypothetical protein
VGVKGSRPIAPQVAAQIAARPPTVYRGRRRRRRSVGWCYGRPVGRHCGGYELRCQRGACEPELLHANPPHPYRLNGGGSYTKSPPLGVAARPQLGRIHGVEHPCQSPWLLVTGVTSQDGATRGRFAAVSLGWKGCATGRTWESICLTMRSGSGDSTKGYFARQQGTALPASDARAGDRRNDGKRPTAEQNGRLLLAVLLNTMKKVESKWRKACCQCLRARPR